MTRNLFKVYKYPLINKKSNDEFNADQLILNDLDIKFAVALFKDGVGIMVINVEEDSAIYNLLQSERQFDTDLGENYLK